MHEPNSLPAEDSSSTPIFSLSSASSSSSSSSSHSNSSTWPSGDGGWSGEPQWHVFVLLFLVAAGVVGNSLVCVAVCVEKKLQNVTNYFLVSLAIADLLVSVVVMPCCIVQEFVGHWPLGVALCNTWLVADVTLCTSSIMHMCTISMDRYLGVKFPLKMRNRSKFIVGVKVILVWLFSLTLASPLVFIGMSNSLEILNSDGQCGIFNPYFLIYGSLVAFFVPFMIMLITYTLTIRLLSKRARTLKSTWNDSCMVRSVGRKKIRSRSRKWVSLNSTTESSTENETINSTKLHRTGKRSRIYGFSRIQREAEINADPRHTKSSESDGHSYGSTEDLRSLRRRTKRSLRRVLIEPMIRNKMKCRPPSFRKDDNKTRNCSSSADSELQTSGISTNVRTFGSKSLRRGSLRCTRCFDGLDCQAFHGNCRGVQSIFKRHNSRNSAPPSYTNLASNFSKALPMSFKHGKDKNQIKADILTAGKCCQLKNLLRPTLSLDTTRIHYEMYRSSEDSDPFELIKDGNEARKHSKFEETLQNTTILMNRKSPICDSISFDKNMDSPLHSFIERFLVSREAGKQGQMNSVRTEKKAVKVLGAMFCFFFLCWSSFFVMNILIGICRNCRFNSVLFKCFLWLGYSSSIVNPIIYTIFNKAFKQTFQSLLTCSTKCFLYKSSSSSSSASCSCFPPKTAVGPFVDPVHRRSTTTTTTSSSNCRRLSTRKSIAISFSEEWLDKHHVRMSCNN